MVFSSCLQIFGYQDVDADGVLIDGFVIYCADASPYLVLWNVSGLSTPCIYLPCKILRLAERFESRGKANCAISADTTVQALADLTLVEGRIAGEA